MSSGPILIFDKSLLEALSLDESVWLGQFFRVNVTPMFFVETIADLEKDVAQGRTAEGVVARLALKTNAMTADPNAHHVKMCEASLMGVQIDMHDVPAVEGGRPIEQKGKKGLVFDLPPEAKMLERWQKRQFSESDRETARNWRASLADLDLESTYKTFRQLAEHVGKPKDLAGAKAFADSLLIDEAQSERMLGLALVTLGIRRDRWGDIFDRWGGADRPILPKFAPYAAYCLGVELFFSIAVGSDLISKDRPSNKVDIAYLFYLPFCMVFTSGDKLHEATVPLFLHAKQSFVRGAEMKASLKKLDEHYSALPEETKAKGVMSFAHSPPLEGDFLVSALWDRHLMPIWREPRDAKPGRTAAEERDLVREMREWSEGSAVPEGVPIDSADFVIIKRSVPVQVGKWRILPPGVEDDPRNRTD